MTGALILLFGALSVSLVIWGLRTSRTYEFPFFAGCVMSGWVLPEMISEWNSRYLLPEYPFQLFLTMACVCAGAIAVSTFFAKPRPPIPGPAVLQHDAYDRGTLKALTTILFVVGMLFFIKLRMIPWEQLHGGWKGAPVAYFFFSRVLRYAFAIALFLWLDRKDGFLLAIVVCCALAYLDRIVFFGRRAEGLRFALTILLALYFRWNYRLPRPVLMAGVVAASLMISAVALYRPHVRGQENPDWEGVSQIDLKENFMNVLRGDSGAEVRKGTHLVGAVTRRKDFNFGTSYWDHLVREFVPRQLIGSRAKQALMLTPVTPEEMAYQEYGFIGINGATAMGFSDTYASFWFFGAIVFAVVTVWMARFFRRAEKGDLHTQVLYTLLLVEALHTITHDTGFALARAVHVFCFVTPCFYIARSVALKKAATQVNILRAKQVEAAIR